MKLSAIYWYEIFCTMDIYRSRSVIQVDGLHCPRQFLSESCFCRWLSYRDIWVDRLKWSTVYILFELSMYYLSFIFILYDKRVHLALFLPFFKKKIYILNEIMEWNLAPFIDINSFLQQIYILFEFSMYHLSFIF